MIRRWGLLVLTAVVLLAGAVLIGQETGPYGNWIWQTIALSVVGGALVLASTWQWRHEDVSRRWLLVVVLFGVVLRLAIIPSTRELSDDAARYHWDGKAIAHGVNPFLHSPDEPAVAHLWTDAIDERINHPWNRTCYPPVAEGLFTVGYLLSPGSLRGLQLLCLMAEILTWFLLAQELARRKRSAAWLLLMVWSPLLVCQGYLPGHLDLLLLPFVALLISATLAKNAARAGLWLALACLIKPLPLLWLPAIARELGLRRTVRLVAVCAIVGILAYLPFWKAGSFLFSSTWLMATDWSFNGSIGAVLESVLTKRQAHLGSGFLTGLGLILTTWRGRDFLGRALAAQVVFVAFTPTLFPWYLVSTLPLLVLRPQAALLALVLLIPLSDQVVIAHHLRGVWHESPALRWAQYLPFYGLLVWDRINNRNRNRQPPDPTGGTPRSRSH